MDFHRSNLHGCLLDRAIELGAKLIINAQVNNVEVSDNESEATVFLEDGRRMTVDLVVGADGINSRLQEVLLCREKSTRTH